MKPGWDPRTSELVTDRTRLDRIGTAERVADVLRDRIVEGFFRPGTQLSEESIGAALGVSRNTLREAFRLLCHECLAVHEFGRGVFVRRLSTDDVVDLYCLRRLVECAALKELPRSSSDVLVPIRLAVERGQAAAMAGDWRAAGTADLHFHRGIAAIAGSPRVDDLVRRVLAELRLAFAVMPDPRDFHEPYISWNLRIYQMLAEGNVDAAAVELVDYLRAAEAQLVAASMAAEPIAAPRAAAAVAQGGAARGDAALSLAPPTNDAFGRS